MSSDRRGEKSPPRTNAAAKRHDGPRELSRRGFFKTCAVMGAAAATSPGRAAAAGAARDKARPDSLAVLVDVNQCVGCQACELACSQQNGLPEPPDLPADGTWRDTSENQFTVLNKPRGSDESTYAKRQCLHCQVPACSSACPVKALDKTPDGPVVYHADRCIGCRYCMVACPFGIPKYQYDRAVPYVRKCTMCAGRLAEGKPPACVEACESGTLTFGRRSELLEEAKKRIYSGDGNYVRHVYGEREAGGTSWLYIGPRPMTDFGLPDDVGDRPFYELTRGALGAVPLITTLWPPILMGLYAASSRRAEVEAASHEHGEER